VLIVLIVHLRSNVERRTTLFSRREFHASVAVGA